MDHQREKTRNYFQHSASRSSSSRSCQKQPWGRPGRGYPGEFVLDSDVKFLPNQDVDGVHLLSDFDKCSEIHTLLGNFAKGPTYFFPAMWHSTLSTKNIFYLEANPYVLTPKPVGPRFFLYADPSGTIYLENMTQHVFRVDEHHAIKLCPDTVLDGIVTWEKSKNSEDKCVETESKGRRTFVIQDAIRCNGVDLTKLNIVERITFIQEQIMKPRESALKNGMASDDFRNEAFNLDIVQVKDASLAKDFLSAEFEEKLKYPLRAFLFYPRHMGYKSEKCKNVLQWSENEHHGCSFRLKIQPEHQSQQADLIVVGPFRKDFVYGTITLTDEIRELDGQIIDCDFVNHRWVFKKLSIARKHPNGKKAVDGKMVSLQNPVSLQHLLSSLEKSKGRDC